MIARRYEDLEVWQLADELKRGVYALLKTSKARFDRRFAEQLKESAASAPSNLAEGFTKYRHPEFANQTRIAKSSLAETDNHLRDGVDRGYWLAETVKPLRTLADRAIGKCVRLLAHLETTDAPGTMTRSRSRSRSRARTTFPKRER